MKKHKKEKLVILKESPEEQVSKKTQDPYQRVLYFSYGSNNHMRQLVERVGKVQKICTFELKDYRLSFDCGYDCAFANLLPCEGETTEGVIYEMFYYQLKQLDRYEALYERKKIVLTDERFRDRKLHFYISKYRNKNFENPLTPHYYKTLLRGAIENDLRKTLSILEKIDKKNVCYRPKNIYDTMLDF